MNDIDFVSILIRAGIGAVIAVVFIYLICREEKDGENHE